MCLKIETTTSHQPKNPAAIRSRVETSTSTSCFSCWEMGGAPCPMKSRPRGRFRKTPWRTETSFRATEQEWGGSIHTYVYICTYIHVYIRYMYKFVYIYSYIIYPIGSMHGISIYIYDKNQLNVGKYIIHGFYGYACII